MGFSVTRKLLQSRLVDGTLTPSTEIALAVDQVLLQDVLGALAMLEFEAMGLDRIRVPLAAQSIDHNLVEADHMNADEHLFLRSACRRFGIWYSRAGNGISHPVHMARFGRPGEVLVGSDSHSPAAGSLGMLAFGAGGAEMGTTTSVFPSDKTVRAFVRAERREADWVEIRADDDAEYDECEELDLSALEPLIATSSSPGNVVTVRSVAGREIAQSYVGSSANPGYRDFAIAAAIVRGGQVHDRVSLDINPSSRQVLQTLVAEGALNDLVAAGAPIHQAGCNGCIGMGQAPATGRISLRTVPRNFPGRSGTREDSVYLCSPETAAASALTGVITDGRDLGMDYPRLKPPANPAVNTAMLVPPLPALEAAAAAAAAAALDKTDNIGSVPELGSVPDALALAVALKLGHDISTDHIVQGGTRVMPHWSNVPKLVEYVYEQVDPTYPVRAAAIGRQHDGHAIVGGLNYSQGSSRENAALPPRHLGLRVVLARFFARIHFQNLVNFGVVPLTFVDEVDYDRLAQGDTLRVTGLHTALRGPGPVEARCNDGCILRLRHALSARQAEVSIAGGVINWLRAKVSAATTAGDEVSVPA